MKKLFKKIKEFFKNLFGGKSSKADPKKFDWCYGGLNGSKAVEDPAVKIVSASQKGDTIYYDWGDTPKSFWGVGNTDAQLLFCVFFKDGSTYKGGKMEWTSRSRRTRDIKNIKSGYNGWSLSKFNAAKEIAVCVISKDGKKRSNFCFYSK